MLRILCHIDRRLATILGTVFTYGGTTLWDTSNRETQFEVPVVLENGEKGQSVQIYVNEDMVIGLEQEGQFFIRKDGSDNETAWRGIADDDGRTLVQENGNYSMRINGVLFQTRNMTYKATKISFVREVANDQSKTLPSSQTETSHVRIPLTPESEPERNTSNANNTRRRKRPPAPKSITNEPATAQDAEDSGDENENPMSDPHSDPHPSSAGAQSLPTLKHDIHKSKSPFDPSEVHRITTLLDKECYELRRLHPTYNLNPRFFQDLDPDTATFLNIIATIHATLSCINPLIQQLNFRIELKDMIQTKRNHNSTTYQSKTHRLEIVQGRTFILQINDAGYARSESMALANVEGKNEILTIAIQECMNATQEPCQDPTQIKNCTSAMLFFFTCCGEVAVKESNNRPYIEFPQGLFARAKGTIDEIIDLTAPWANQVNHIIRQTHMRSRLALDINPW
jgi:hypothetical protein